MSQSRKRTALLVAAVLAVVLVATGIKTVPDGAVGVRDSPLRGDAVLGPGVHWRLSLVERIVVLAPYRREARVDFTTREGASRSATYAVSVFFALDQLDELVASQPEGSGVARIDAAIDQLVASTLGAGGELSTEPDAATRASVTAALSAYGRIEDPLTLAYTDDSPMHDAIGDAELREQVRRLARPTGARVLLVGLDGADWQIAEPLIEQGRLPHLAALRRRGAWGNVKSLTPILSPLLWTSVATGVTPDRHGILDFLARDPATGRKSPVKTGHRKVRAFWNQLGHAGLTSDVVAWWATWPAERINGHMISDRVSYSLFDFDLPAGGAGATWPTEYFDSIRDELVTDASIPFAEVRRFADVSREEFDSARALIGADRATAYRHPLNHLTKILAATRNYHRIGLDLLRRGPADVTAVYYQGIDEVCHRFVHYTEPRMEHVDSGDVRRYGRVVERFYEWQDALLGELLAAAGDEATVIVVSDHGFINGPDRPAGQTADIEGQPGRWHRRYGMLLLAGPPIEPGRLDTTSLLDVHPTLLRLTGVPVPEDGDGRVLEEALTDDFEERHPPIRLASYETTRFRAQTAAAGETVAAVEAEILENLRSLGYIGGDDLPAADVAATSSASPASGDEATVDGADTITGHVNLAVVLLADGDIEGAERETLAALGLSPNYPDAVRLLFHVRLRQERFDDAIGVAERLCASPEHIDDRLLARLAQAYDRAGRTSAGVERHRRGFAEGRPGSGVVLARLLLQRGDLAGAEQTARQILDRDPMNQAALATSFRAAQSRGDLSAVRPSIERALELNPRSVLHLNWLAVVEEGAGDSGRAETLLKQALEVDPDHGGSMANLGAFYGRHGRADDAVPLLQRALRIDPGNLEAQINLGTAFGRLGRLQEAIGEFESVVDGGSESTGVYNALAMAYGRLGDETTAADWLRRSLALDPQQDQVRNRLESLNR